MSKYGRIATTPRSFDDFCYNYSSWNAGTIPAEYKRTAGSGASNVSMMTPADSAYRQVFGCVNVVSEDSAATSPVSKV